MEHKGYKSRKLILAYVTLALIFVGFILTGRYPALAVTYAEYCMGILAAASIYAGANAAVKFLTKPKANEPPVEPGPEDQ